MSLSWKLFLSYLGVIAISLLILSLSTAFVAPVTFSEQLQHIPRMMGGGPPGGVPPGFQRGQAAALLQTLEAELDANFRQAVNGALVLAAVAATLAAGATSWTISRRIVRPIREMSRASQRIAAGHYEERLAVQADDELGELTRNFNRMAEALAQTEAMRQQLIADVSHELKTPLASIQGYMEGLQDGIIPPTAETFQLVHREADRLQRLVRDLQELSRAEAAQLQLELHAQDANELARSAVEWLRPQFDDKGIALEVALFPQPVRVRADFDRARQVLLNLLGNALQYTPPGGRVTLRLDRADSVARFAVEDTGVGLASDDLEHIFQRFYRVDKSRSRASGGSGIGLTIARHIVEAHGGRIWAESAGPGQGSTFTFTLPLA